MQDDPIIPEPEDDVHFRSEAGRTSGRHSPPPGAPDSGTERNCPMKPTSFRTRV